jgi:hypothetical protein
MSQSAAASGDAEHAPTSPRGGPPTSPSSMRLLLFLVVAGAVVGGVVALVVNHRGGASAAPQLQAVTRADLENAILSMNSATAAQAVDEARRCKAPLAYVTLQAAPGPTPVRVQIRSGGYLSPSILLSDAPRRVAIPFPEPYLTGRGELFLEGEPPRPVTIWLQPGRSVDPGSPNIIPVVWTPSIPC